MRRSARLAAVVLLLAACLPAYADLKAGDILPDCSKVPLVSIADGYSAEGGSRPISVRPPSVEYHIPDDGVMVLHFCSPRLPRDASGKSYFIEELSALAKAAHTVPYACHVVPVVPLGEKGRRDAQERLRELEEAGDRWAESVDVLYEPTYPRPGLYRTFHPGAEAYGAKQITTSWTYIIGPDRRVIAVREPGANGQLYDWLQQNLPEMVTAAPATPTTDLSVARPGTWLWPAFRRSVLREARVAQMEDTLPYSYLAWRTRIGRTFSSPAVVEGRVYAATDGDGLSVLSLEKGETLAQADTDTSWWTSPAVAGEYVYTIDARGKLLALDRLTLEERWKRGLQGMVTSSPLVANGALYVGSRNGALYALDAETGESLWRVQTGGEISSSPALAAGIVLIGSGDRYLYAVDATSGELKWNLETQGAVDSSPTVADGDVFVGSFDGCLYSVKLSTGEVSWKADLGGLVHSSAAVDENTVFVGTVAVRAGETPAFYWIERSTGVVKARAEMSDAVYSSPTIWGDTVLVGCRDGRLYAFDRTMQQTQPMWTYKTGSYVHSSPVVIGDTVLFASYDGFLYALRQSKPIRVWQQDDLIPRWFMAALGRHLHEGTESLVVRAAAADVGTALKLPDFDTLFVQVQSETAVAASASRVLPRDVPIEHPGAQYVEYVLTAGLLRGYPDATFHPSEPTTRYQFALALATIVDTVSDQASVWRILKQNNLTNVVVEVRAQRLADSPPIMLKDVPDDHWAYPALKAQADLGLLMVDEEGLFRGDRNVTLRDARAQWDLVASSLEVQRER